MSSPVSGISGGGANWFTPTSSGTNTSGQSGPSFAQVAAAAGLVPPGTGSGGTGGTAGSGTTGASGSGATGAVPGTGGTTGTGQPPALGGTGASGAGAAGSTPGGSVPGQSGLPTGTGGTGSTTGAGAASGSSPTNSGTIADLSGTDTFLKLLVAQLKNQDPTSPMDDQAFVTELAQFNTVEQMINLKTAMTTQTTTQQANEGIGMLGRAVTYVTPGLSGNNPVTGQGTVSGVSLGGGVVTLQIGAQQVPLSEVTAVGGSGVGTSVPSLGGSGAGTSAPGLGG